MTNIPEINNTDKEKLKILVAPLDWGLGHATRCIPIINQLLALGSEVIIASDGPQKALLELEFPAVRFVDLKGYRLKYGQTKRQTWLKIILQIPKILIQINREKRWLERFLRQEGLDALISDNRYGLHAPSLFSVFLTHQLRIKTYFGKTVEDFLQWLIYRKIQRFSICWVPDFEKSDSLAGKLSHPVNLPSIPIRYIGPLTRFKKSVTKPGNQLLLILSGPEPQRSIFEEILLHEIKNYSGKAVLIRGLPGESASPATVQNLEIHNHLAAAELNEVLNQSEYVISRSGYSSIMDLILLGKKIIMVPTPGQPEQEYLATYLFNRQLLFTTLQEGFSLRTCLETASNFSYNSIPDGGRNLLQSRMEEWIRSIHQHNHSV